MSESSEADYAEALTREAGVASIPVSAFYRDVTDHKVLRFCFAKKESTLAAAVERLKAYGI
jgi:methionine aminotransferase